MYKKNFDMLILCMCLARTNCENLNFYICTRGFKNA